MLGFYEFVESRGGENVRELIDFIQQFVNDPSVYLELTVDEKVEVEKKLDAALALLTATPLK